MDGIDADTVKTVALIAVAVLALSMVVVMAVVRSVMQKLIAVALLAVVAIAIWAQRASLDDCIDGLSKASGKKELSCTFFGRDVAVDVPG